MQVPVSQLVGRSCYVCGTFGHQGPRTGLPANCLQKLGLHTVTVDLSTSQMPPPRMSARTRWRASIQKAPAPSSPTTVARRSPPWQKPSSASSSRDGTSRRYLGGGSGGTSLATPAMRRLPIGTPKVMVSTVALGRCAPLCRPVGHLHDVFGEPTSPASTGSRAGAFQRRTRIGRHGRPCAAWCFKLEARDRLTMFGVTTPCVQAVQKALEERFDCLVFHATGTGGQSMEKLADSGLLAGVIDVTTTEVCDHLFGGVFSAGEERFDAIIRSKIPYVASAGALDMVNFGPMDTVPAEYRGRNLYVHNPQVTLMRLPRRKRAHGPLDRREAEPEWTARCVFSFRSAAFRCSICRASRSMTRQPMRRSSRRLKRPCGRTTAAASFGLPL